MVSTLRSIMRSFRNENPESNEDDQLSAAIHAKMKENSKQDPKQLKDGNHENQ